jgi:hypothetical protein
VYLGAPYAFINKVFLLIKKKRRERKKKKLVKDLKEKLHTMLLIEADKGLG